MYRKSNYLIGENPCNYCLHFSHSNCKKRQNCTCNCPNEFVPYFQKRTKTHCKHGHEFTLENTHITNLPNGKQHKYCKTCWKLNREKNRERIKEIARKHYQKCKNEISILRKIQGRIYADRLKREVLTYYGNGHLVCVCCGESTYQFLTLDHINNDGAKDRRMIRRSGHNIYRYLRKMKYPSGFQTLCFNCNSGKEINNGLCPHKQMKMILISINKYKFSYKIDTSIKEGDRPRLS